MLRVELLDLMETARVEEDFVESGRRCLVVEGWPKADSQVR